MSHFLISFNRTDQAQADWIASQLEHAGHTTVLQDIGDAQGTVFVEAMRQAAVNADRIIPVLSPAYLTAAFTPSIWQDCFPQDPTGRQGLIVPVLVAPFDVEDILGPIMYVDLVGLATEEASAALLASLERRRDITALLPSFSIRAPSPAPAPAPMAGTEEAPANEPSVRRMIPGVRDLGEEVPTTGTTAGDRTGGQPTEPLREVTTRVSGSFPPVVAPGSVHTLGFEVGERASGDIKVPVKTLVHATAKTLDLTVVVQTPHFVVVGPDRESPAGGTADISLPLDNPDALEKGQFLLKAIDTEERIPSVIRLRFLHNNNPVGVIRIPTTIDPVDTDKAPTEQAIAGDVYITTRAPQGPELLLLINREHDGTYEITATLNAGLGGSIPRARLGAFPVTGEAWEYAKSLLENFKGVEGWPESERVERVDNLGLDLWRKLPKEFHTFYWEHVHEKVKTILVCSEEPYIPWELVKPERTPGGETAPMLGQAFAMARWDDERRLPNSIEVEDFVVIAPAYATNALPSAALEADELASTFGARRVDPGKRSQVVELLKSPDIQVLHFSGHGEFKDTPNDSRIALADFPLEVIDVNGARFLQSPEPPLVFLNACEVGSLGWSLTQIGGWADAFCASGSAAFIGPYWAVNDRVAYKAAMLFYGRLREGMTIGAAMQDIRDQFYLDVEDRYHPSWLAYSLHCHPNVTVHL